MLGDIKQFVAKRWTLRFNNLVDFKPVEIFNNVLNWNLGLECLELLSGLSLSWHCKSCLRCQSILHLHHQ